MIEYKYKQEFYFYRKGKSGSFLTSLLDAFHRADYENFYKLSQVFPEYAALASKCKNEDGFSGDLELEVEVELGIASPERVAKRAIQVMSGDNDSKSFRDF